MVIFQFAMLNYQRVDGFSYKNEYLREIVTSMFFMITEESNPMIYIVENLATKSFQLVHDFAPIHSIKYMQWETGQNQSLHLSSNGTYVFLGNIFSIVSTYISYIVR